MFPSVVKDDSLNNKIKEKQWDDRLGPKSNIPDYSPLKDKHTKSYRRIITTKKEDVDLSPKPTKATYFQKRLDLVEELNSIHQSNTNLIEQFQELAGKYKLPNFYIFFTLLPLRNTSNNITQYLFKEKKGLKEQSSHYHKMVTAIRAREECLERLRKTLGQLSEEKLESTKTELKEEVDHLRFLTENAIDEIKRWRDDLGQIDERAVYFTDAQENYLIKILNDNKFIFSSKLAGALSFGEKNDPFLLVPAKRSEGKQASMFSDIVKLSKGYSHYQRYMQFLAEEKAYDLSLNPILNQQQGYRNPVVEKVYKSTQPKIDSTINKDEDDDGYKKMELMKVREDRLKKNSEKMKNIKSIYETYQKKVEAKPERQYRSEKKLPETDNEDKRGRKRRSESIKLIKNQSPSDIEFESLVKVRLEAQKNERKDKSKTPLKRSSSHSNKSQEKMIESLRDIQSTLRSKLQVIHQQQKTQTISSSQLMSSTQQRFTRKTNEELVRELKAEIMGKIQKEASEKQKLKKLKRDQQEKALEEVKMKLKKEMQQKLQQKKKEKILQREQLEKKLKEEEDRLNSQRQLELQLQLKLTREKQLRELQKIRRESLERQKKYKEELDKQIKLRREKEQIIASQRREKEKLLEDIRKKQLREQIEEELRKQIKTNKKDGQIDFSEQEFIRAQKEAELSKEIQSLKLRQGVEMLQLKKENELRQRMLKLKKEQQQLKRKEIEQLMRTAVQRQKQNLQQDTMKQRIELEERMRSNVKQKMLEEYRNEKEAQIDRIKHERERQMEQQVYRDKIRDKIEREMRMEAINRTKKELDERQTKKIEARSKLEQVKSKFDKEIVLDKFKIEEQVKKEMVEKVILDKQAQKEAAKYDLRMQFEKQLLASAIPELYENKESSIMFKNINYFEGDLHLESKIQELKPTNQKPSNQSPTKKIEKGDVKPLIDSMTLQQLQIYGKQKQKVSESKEEKTIIPTRLPEEEEGFERLNIDKTNREEAGYQVKVIKFQQSQMKSEKEKQKHRSKNKKKRQSSSEMDSEEEAKKKKKNRRKPKRHYYEEESEEDSEEVAKRKKREKKRKQSSDQKSQSSSEVQKSPSKNIPKPLHDVKDFKSQEEKKSKIDKPLLREPSKPIQRENSEKPAVVYYDAQNKSKVNPIEPVSFRPQKASNTSQKFKITLDAIPEAEFDEHLQVHLSSVPQTQISVQMHNRQELFRKLIGQLTFCLLVGQHEGRVVGQALAYHDRARSDIRKFIIVHMASYKEEDLQDFILSASNYIFRKDPCDQIEFHYRFDESQEDQLQFSQKFNKWFDKYGSVYQKKADDTIYERKYVLKRQFNQKCEVVLGGINKNIFRNLFSVYCGVLMSDTDMLQFKEQLIDTLAPENQMSYSLIVSQLFRTYLSPDEAESLKNKVKQFVKLKEMLILVVSMQKKKLKLDQLKLYEYKNLIELNMRLMSQGKDIIRYCKDTHAELNRIYYAELNQAFNLPFHFQTTSLPVEANNQGEIRQISYFRLSPLPPFKLHIIKSSLYNAEMNILPTQNSKYKIFVINAQEYNQIKESNHLDIFMYIRLFLKNVKSHNVAVWKYVWLPEMTDKGAWNLREFKSFLNKDFYAHDQINISYRQFLPGALIIEPQHRDLVITPPFIVGVMSMGLQQISEGSPLYARMIEINALKTIEVEKS